MQLMIDHLLTADGHGMLYSPFFNYSYGDLSFNYEAHMHPSTRMGLADAGAHVRVICDGGTPTFMLTHWTRDRTRGPRMPLEHVVHRQTRQTAELYGLGDRGLLAPGMRADVNVIDYDALTFGAPRMAWDLPGGAPRLVQKARGLPPHVRRRRRDRARRRVHRRAAGPPGPRSALIGRALISRADPAIGAGAPGHQHVVLLRTAPRTRRPAPVSSIDEGAPVVADGLQVEHQVVDRARIGQPVPVVVAPVRLDERVRPVVDLLAVREVREQPVASR